MSPYLCLFENTEKEGYEVNIPISPPLTLYTLPIVFLAATVIQLQLKLQFALILGFSIYFVNTGLTLHPVRLFEKIAIDVGISIEQYASRIG